MDVAGWDIGGVNTKLAVVRGSRLASARSVPFELQRAPRDLPALLSRMAAEAGLWDASHGVTMTAELSQMFATKREGVTFVIDAVETAFRSAPTMIYGVDGRFHTPADARRRPLVVAAANWVATATVVAQDIGDAVLIDTGTTTTDIIPLVGGQNAAVGLTDMDRLASGELVYTGAVRTPIEAILTHVPIGHEVVAVSAEGFALAADVHLWLGALAPDDYSVDTPDGRPKSRESAAIRLARVVCADRDRLDDQAIDHIAQAVADAQAARVASAIERVRARHPHLHTAVITGVGEFIAAAAARAVGLRVHPLANHLGAHAARSAPAAAVALLLEQSLAIARRP